MTQMRHGAFLATIDLTEFGFAARAASSIPLTDARLRQRCFLFRKSHRDYAERLFWQMLTIGGPHCWQGVSKGAANGDHTA